MKGELSMLHEIIGIPAMLEQTAEECVEMAHACLKLARHMRGENKVHKTIDEMYSNLSEEIADVSICMSELLSAGIISYESLDSDIIAKKERMQKRIQNDLYTKGE